ncbi:F0F1 ATP synthase subunit B [uncultured Thiodictyon sp.]|uniref:F0F1 ATP synthase subunit B family protein n=1 Tax=uncultured Thiodictyon sp. TaxID=1846217 RepID=UPI0025D6A124|nr:F0F1 ATP synthase subunit B [uncultured Thiodictyon sp.]
MLIDWFTVGAQAINFLVLVWLLKRFLYQPILHAIDERERRIAAELADAAAKQAAAQTERESFEHKNQAFDEQRATLFSQAVDEAKTERQRLLGEARQAADALAAQRAESLRSEAKQLNQAILLRTQHEVFLIARKALSDLAGADLEERMVQRFISRLSAMDVAALSVFADALTTASDPACIRSAFELRESARAALTQAIHSTFGVPPKIRFETTPELLGGIELTANGQKIAWDIADYLASLEQGVGELLNAKGQPAATPATAPASTPAP